MQDVQGDLTAGKGTVQLFATEQGIRQCSNEICPNKAYDINSLFSWKPNHRKKCKIESI